MGIFRRLLIYLMFPFLCGEEQHGACTSPQFLELGKSGTVSCSFQEGFFGVFWYNSSDVAGKPIITLKETVKGGDGFVSGEFDIQSDGSLIITNVSLIHEKVFSVAFFESTSQNPVYHRVDVIVLVKSPSSYPLVQGCENERDLCLLPSTPNSAIECYVLRSRPAAHLVWIARTVKGDKNVSTDTDISEEGSSYSARAVTRDQFYYTNLLSLLVCKVESHTQVLDQEEMRVLLFNSNTNFTSMVPVSKFNIELNKAVSLKCSESNNSSYIVWLKNSEEAIDYLLYAVHVGNKFVSKISSNYNLGNEGSLIIPMVETHHEGLYHCIFGDGIKNGIAALDATVYVNPIPRYLVVHGCENQQYCVLQTQRKGSVTCSVYGIRPPVTLEWRKVDYETEESPITFTNHSLTVSNEGNTFNVSLTSEFEAKRQYKRVTIECKISEPMAALFPLSSIFDLRFDDESSTHTGTPPLDRTLLIVFLTGGAFLLLFLFLLFVIVRVNPHEKGRGNWLHREPSVVIGRKTVYSREFIK